MYYYHIITIIIIVVIIIIESLSFSICFYLLFHVPVFLGLVFQCLD